MGAPMDRLRVLFVNTPTLPPMGADTWVQLQVLEHLDRAKHEVHIALVTGQRDRPTPTLSRVRTISDVHVVPTNFGPEFQTGTVPDKIVTLAKTLPAPLRLLQLATYIRKHRIQVIYTSDRPRDAYACTLLSRMTGVPTVVHLHVAYGDWMNRMLTTGMQRADALIAISEFTKQSFVTAGYAADDIHVVHNGIDLDRWVPSADDGAIRREFAIPVDAPMIVSVCRLFAPKGPAELIRAVADVRTQVPDLRLVIVGEELYGGYRAELDALVDDLDLGGCVTFAGRRSDVPAIMGTADLYAMPSFEEPFGLVFVEAMAMRLPVVALSSGGAPEIVEHDITGLLSAPGDHSALVHNIRMLVDRPELRAAMGARGRKVALSRFSSARMAAEVGDVLALIALSTKRRPRARKEQS